MNNDPGTESGGERFPCPKCGKQTPLGQSECQHCASDLAVLQTTISAANLHFNRALEYAKENRLDEAILELQAALELWDRNPKYHNLLGKVLAQKGMYTRAILQWEKTLDLDASFKSAYQCIENARKLERFAGERRLTRIPRWTFVALSLLGLIMIIVSLNLHSKARHSAKDLKSVKRNLKETEGKSHDLQQAMVVIQAQQTAVAMYFQTPTPGSVPEATLPPSDTPIIETPAATPTLEIVVQLNNEVSTLKQTIAQKDAMIEEYRMQLTAAKLEQTSAETIAAELSQTLERNREEWTLKEADAKQRLLEAKTSEDHARAYASTQEQQVLQLNATVKQIQQEKSELEAQKKQLEAELEQKRQESQATGNASDQGTNYRMILDRGKQFQQTGQLERAMILLESASKIEDASHEASALLDQVRQSLAARDMEIAQILAQAESMFASGDLAGASVEFGRILQLNPDHSKARQYQIRIQNPGIPVPQEH